MSIFQLQLSLFSLVMVYLFFGPLEPRFQTTSPMGLKRQLWSLACTVVHSKLFLGGGGDTCVRSLNDFTQFIGLNPKMEM